MLQHKPLYAAFGRAESIIWHNLQLLRLPRRRSPAFYTQKQAYSIPIRFGWLRIDCNAFIIQLRYALLISCAQLTFLALNMTLLHRRLGLTSTFEVLMVVWTTQVSCYILIPACNAHADSPQPAALHPGSMSSLLVVLSSPLHLPSPALYSSYFWGSYGTYFASMYTVDPWAASAHSRQLFSIII